MRIFQVSISQDYLQSDHWCNIFNDENKSKSFSDLLDWNYDDHGINAYVIESDTPKVLSTILKDLDVLGVMYEFKDITSKYIFSKTNAPDTYDGFGTMTISTKDNERIVAMQKEHKDWQSMRYGSGLFFSVPISN